MGRIYCGPYADLLERTGEYDHEGYGEMELPDGSMTASWGPETPDPVAYRPACACGWRGTGRYGPDETGEESALGEWDRDHLQPMVAKAEASWTAWADGVAAMVRNVAVNAAAGRYSSALVVLERIERDVRSRAQVLGMLADTE